MLGPEFDEIERAIPDDHARKCSAEAMLGETLAAASRPDLRVLDLGCGDGRGVDLVRGLLPTAHYCGIDIEDSPEVRLRGRGDAEFHSFDGVGLPFADGSFDVVYSRQVFEHVRHPDALVAEVARALRPGGVFTGSLSYLEPYHSFSIFNFTPYGLFRLIEDNGLTLRQMRPGAEGFSLIVRQLTMRLIPGFGIAYPLVDLAGAIRGWDARRRNYLKLRLAGHICFQAVKDF